jgi:hypothetical protein
MLAERDPNCVLHRQLPLRQQRSRREQKQKYVPHSSGKMQNVREGDSVGNRTKVLPVTKSGEMHRYVQSGCGNTRR